ncbi:MAG: YjiH family protein [Spirochaetes bacterium]|nr:YjiH family protein [Spirochaetota bacterium]
MSDEKKPSTEDAHIARFQNQSLGQPPEGANILKFAGISLVGVFLFLTPLPHGQAFNIPLGIAIDWLRGVFSQIEVGQYNLGSMGLHYLLALIAITASLLGSVLAYTVKPGFLVNNPKVREIFQCSPVYFASKAIGFAVIWMIFLDVGPDFVIRSWTGDLMLSLVAGLVVIFIFLAPAMPLVTDFGLMEFIGVSIKKAVRFLFTLPGRASVDLMASWFGSSAASVIITRGQHERGFYTGREAAVIATNFSFVSLPFSFVIASTIGLQAYFLLFYLIVCITCVILALIMPRIWPLRSLPDTYLEGVGKQIEEDVPQNVSTGQWALRLACERARRSTAAGVARAGAMNYLNIFMDLIPIILSWGTLALIVVEFTEIFDTISLPMGGFLHILGVEGAFEFATATLVGFIDMYIPALLIVDAPFQTRVILGALSIVQIIYMAETGVLIVKSKMPLNVWKLLVLFLMRTVLALPVIVLLTRLFF